MIRFILPLPPSVNKLYANVGKRRIKTKPYESWIKEAGMCLIEQRVKRITKRCILHYGFEHPDNRRRDESNMVKALTDLLVSHGILEDDCRKYVKGTYSFWLDVKGGVVEVKIETVD